MDVLGNRNPRVRVNDLLKIGSARYCNEHTSLSIEETDVYWQ
jgi:hypothetical protein